MALRNCNPSDDDNDDNDDNGIGNSMGSGQNMRANTRNGNKHVRPDKCGENDDNPSEDDATRFLEWFPLFTPNELVTELVFPLSGIYVIQ
jgi:hypothetical protein